MATREFVGTPRPSLPPHLFTCGGEGPERAALVRRMRARAREILAIGRAAARPEMQLLSIPLSIRRLDGRTLRNCASRRKRSGRLFLRCQVTLPAEER